MAIEFTQSARQHGFTVDDAVTAIANATWYAPRFDPARVEGLPDPSAWVGPSRSGIQIEVLAYVVPPRTLVIFHCMEARAKTIETMRKGYER